jgi:hypothetical protein
MRRRQPFHFADRYYLTVSLARFEFDFAPEVKSKFKRWIVSSRWSNPATEENMDHHLQLRESGSGSNQASIAIDKATFMVGNGAPGFPVDLAVKETFISRRHAELRLNDDGTCSIHDIGSTNGTFVNNVRVLSQTLSDGDVVQFGGLKNAPIGQVLAKSHGHVTYLYYCKPKLAASSQKSVKRKAGEAIYEEGLHVDQNQLSLLKAASVQWEREREMAKEQAAKQQQVLKELNEQLQAVSHRLSAQNAATAKLEADNMQHLKVIQESAEKRSALQKQVATLRALVEEREAQAGLLNAELCQERQRVAELEAGPQQVSSTRSSSGLSRGTLAGGLQCTLCEDLLVEACVLPCSHGFCRACIEGHWSAARNKGTAVYGRLASADCKCPRCDYAIPAQGTLRMTVSSFSLLFHSTLVIHATTVHS